MGEGWGEGEIFIFPLPLTPLVSPSKWGRDKRERSIITALQPGEGTAHFLRRYNIRERDIDIMEKVIQRLDRAALVVNRGLIAIAGFLLVAMMVLACTNVFLRTVWIPVKGTYELMGFFGAIVAAFALGRTQMKKEHIAVDVLILRFPRRVRLFLSGINHLVGMIFFSLAGWQTAKWGTNLWRVNELSETLRIIYFPFVYGVALGCGVIALVLLLDMIKLIKNGNGVPR